MVTEKKPKNRWVDAISSMIELTQDGKLKWSATLSSNLPDDNYRTSAIFQTTYNDKALWLYEKRTLTNYSNITVSLIRVTGEEPPKWYKQVVLEFVDSDGRALWRFPDVDALSDLLTSVQYQVVGVHDFLDTIISEARNVPKLDPAKGLKDMASSFNERGNALSHIVKIANDDSKSEKERLHQIRSIAFNTIAKPTF